MSIDSIGPSLTARMWLLLFGCQTISFGSCAAKLSPVFLQLIMQSTATACFDNSSGFSELSIEIVNFHPTEAGLTLKWDRISPRGYGWHQISSLFNYIWVSQHHRPRVNYLVSSWHVRTRPYNFFVVGGGDIFFIWDGRNFGTVGRILIF